MNEELIEAAGNDAYYDDIEYDDNPHTEGSQEYWAWSKGWLDAEFAGKHKNWD
jgi:hypothetical protein